jgi:hypothetical protein
LGVVSECKGIEERKKKRVKNRNSVFLGKGTDKL